MKGTRLSIARVVLVVSVFIVPVGAAACATDNAIGGSTTEGFEFGNTTDSTHGSNTEGHVTTSSTNSDLFFPTQIQGVEEGEPRATPDAMYSRELTLDDNGCLRLDSKPTEKYLLIWPPGYTIKAEGNKVSILDEENRMVATTGRKIKVSGGEIPGQSIEGIAYLSKRLQRELPRRCAGPYWLVGEVVDSKQPG